MAGSSGCGTNSGYAGKYENNTFVNIPESFKLMKFLFNFEIGNYIARRCAWLAHGAHDSHPNVAAYPRRLNMIVIKMNMLV